MGPLGGEGLSACIPPVSPLRMLFLFAHTFRLKCATFMSWQKSTPIYFKSFPSVHTHTHTLQKSGLFILHHSLVFLKGPGSDILQAGVTAVTKPP